MSIVRSLVVNTAARSLTELITRLGAAAFWVIVARSLGAAALGSLAFGLALYSFFTTISTLGLGSVVVRDVARERSRAGVYYSHTLLVTVVFSLLTAAIMIGVTLLLKPNPDTTFAALVLAAAIVPASAFMVGRSLLFAAEDMAKVTLARLGESAFKVLAGLLLLHWGAGVRGIAAALAISKMLPLFIVQPFVSRVAKPVWRLDAPLLRYLVRMIPSFSTISIFNSLFWSAPVVMLTRVSGEYQAGLFAAAFKLVDITLSFSNAYGQALFPIAARTLKHNFDLFKSMFVKSIKYIFIMSAALAAALSVMADQIILFLYGAKMAEAAPILQIIAWMIVPFAVVPILSSTLVSSDLQKRDLLANVSASAVAVITVRLAAPTAGALSAAAAYVSACLIFALIEWASVRRKMFHFSVSAHLWKPIVGVLLMSLLLTWGKELFLPINLAVAGVAYLMFLLLSKSITKNEWLLVKQLKTV
mgnify:CR=1 FL=1